MTFVAGNCWYSIAGFLYTFEFWTAAAAFSLVFHRCDDAEIAPIELVEKAMVLKGVGDTGCVAILACLETAGFDV